MAMKRNIQRAVKAVRKHKALSEAFQKQVGETLLSGKVKAPMTPREAEYTQKGPKV